MDLVDAMNLWFKMGGDTAIEDKGKGKPYITHFVWNGNVEGHQVGGSVVQEAEV